MRQWYQPPRWVEGVPLAEAAWLIWGFVMVFGFLVMVGFAVAEAAGWWVPKSI